MHNGKILIEQLRAIGLENSLEKDILLNNPMKSGTRLLLIKWQALTFVNSSAYMSLYQFTESFV